MKLLLAIVNNDDSAAVANNLTAKGFIATKLATTGGFLKAGNTTFLIGTDDEKVETVIDIIKTFSHKRKQVVGVRLRAVQERSRGSDRRRRGDFRA